MKRDRTDSKMLWYDNVYQGHKNGEKRCRISVNNISKARSLVKHVWHTFEFAPTTNETSILDVGCGLGFISEALREMGGKVLGIDISRVAVECAMASFPLVDYACISFDAVLQKSHKFDIIWALDFSAINTNDMEFINNYFLKPCLDMLNDNGILILGWHTNFTGKDLGNYAQWDSASIEKLKSLSGLVGPQFVKFRSRFLNCAFMYAGKVIGKYGYSAMGKSMPIYFFLRKR